MVDISTLCPGDKVRIVDEWPENGKQNSAGFMDKYLGQILTVRGVNLNNGSCFMLEDMDDYGGSWSWFPNLMAEVVEEDLEPADITELIAFLGI